MSESTSSTKRKVRISSLYIKITPFIELFVLETLLEFEKTSFSVHEGDKFVSLPIQRSGDLSLEAQVECVTQEETALNNLDYAARSKSGVNFQKVRIAPGEAFGFCDVEIIDDELEELETETFRVVLVNPSTGTKLGTKSEARVAILGPNDGKFVFIT